MLKYKDLLKTPPYKRSKFNPRVNKVTSHITKAEIVKRGGKKGVKFSAVGRAATEKVHYQVQVELYPQKLGTQENKTEVYADLNQNTYCWVHCNCPFFKFHSAWVLTKLGSSELGDCDDAAPHITNPKFIPYVCKHLHSVMGKALAAMQKISIPD